MNYEDHVAAARMFLSAAEILSESGMGMAAAEMVWGAAVQAIDAANHSMAATTRHAGSNRDRLRIVQGIGRAHGVDEELARGFEAAANGLHNHFYTGRLPADELEENMRLGVSFARLMLELADSPI